MVLADTLVVGAMLLALLTCFQPRAKAQNACLAHQSTYPRQKGLIALNSC